MADHSNLYNLTQGQIADLQVENGRTLRNKELEVEPFLEEVRRIDDNFNREILELRETYEPQISSLESQLEELEKQSLADQAEIQSLTHILLNMKEQMKNTMIEFVQRVSLDETAYWQSEESKLSRAVAAEEETSKLLTKKALETSAALSILNPKFEEQVAKANKTSRVLGNMLDSVGQQLNIQQLEMDSLTRLCAERSQALQRLQEETAHLSACLAEAAEGLASAENVVAGRLQSYSSGQVDTDSKQVAFSNNRYFNKVAGVVNIFDRELADQTRSWARLTATLQVTASQVEAVQSRLGALQQALRGATAGPTGQT